MTMIRTYSFVYSCLLFSLTLPHHQMNANLHAVGPEANEWLKEAILTLVDVCVVIIGIALAVWLAGPRKWLSKIPLRHCKRHEPLHNRC